MQKLSVVISAYNEEDKIDKCLKSVAFADEIVFVDNSSTDKTKEIAQKYTKSIYSQKNDPLLIDIQKNTGFKKAKYEWILSIDADEVVSDELRKEIKDLINKDNLKDGYFIPRKNIIFGKEINYTGWYPDYQLRLFKKAKGEFKNSHVHEGIQVNGDVGYLKEHMVHYNYESVVQFVQKNMINYAQNEANNLINKDYALSPGDLISIPAKEFLSRYFARRGYKDGIHGLFLSLLMASSHLVVLAMVWEKTGFKETNSSEVLRSTEREFGKFRKELKFWLNSVRSSDSKNIATKYIYRIKGKI